MIEERKKINNSSIRVSEKAALNGRIEQIRSLLFNNSNKEFAQKIGEIEQTLSQICLGKRNAGIEIVQKILNNMPEINANWLLRGEESMIRNEQHVGDISNSHVVGVNVNGGEIHNNVDEYATLLAIMERSQKTTEKFQEQIDRMLNMIEQSLHHHPNATFGSITTEGYTQPD